MIKNFNLATKLERSPHAVCSKVGEETVILHLENGTYYGLDSLGTRVWELLEKGTTVPEICNALLPKYKVSAGILNADITAFVLEMRSHDLVFTDQT
ncbi:PqqD family protein [Falsihalocynthiibacter sp. S25ZX9]|uniref:PqqD family protein n=1 Tax=unclassified Falsihalocynthiibacter TaxID=2854191 RepID=UPI003510B1DF